MDEALIWCITYFVLYTGKQRIEEAIVNGYLSFDRELLASKYCTTTICYSIIDVTNFVLL